MVKIKDNVQGVMFIFRHVCRNLFRLFINETPLGTGKLKFGKSCDSRTAAEIVFSVLRVYRTN